MSGKCLFSTQPLWTRRIRPENSLWFAMQIRKERSRCNDKENSAIMWNSCNERYWYRCELCVISSVYSKLFESLCEKRSICWRDGALSGDVARIVVYSKSKEENCRFLSGLLATNGITYQFHSKSVYFFSLLHGRK